MERLHLPFVNGLLYCRPYMIENISGLDHLCNAAGIDDRSIEVIRLTFKVQRVSYDRGVSIL